MGLIRAVFSKYLQFWSKLNLFIFLHTIEHDSQLNEVSWFFLHERTVTFRRALVKAIDGEPIMAANAGKLIKVRHTILNIGCAFPILQFEAKSASRTKSELGELDAVWSDQNR